MDKYFYSVELNLFGNKAVHILGNVYLNDADPTRKDHRYAEYTSFYMSIDELKDAIENKWLFEDLCERVDYLCDITKRKATHICETYFDGKPGKHLSIYKVNDKTPCGNYWFDGGADNTHD